jgi:O-antigen ligase
VFLLLLIAWVLFSALYGLIIYGYDLIWTLNALKLYFGYLIFFVALTLAGSRDDLERLLRVLLYCSMAFSLAYILLSLVGFESLSQITILGIDEVFPISSRPDLGNLRVYVPAPSLAAMMLLVALSIYFHDPSHGRWWTYGLVIFVNSLAIVFTFTRGYWISIVLFIPLLWFIAPRRHKTRLVPAAIIGLAVIFLAAYALGTFLSIGSTGAVSIISDTFGSLFESGLDDVNAQGRFQELRAALDLWRQSPSIGLGIAASWIYNGRILLVGSHSNLSQLLPRLGLVGAGLYLTIIVWFLVRVWTAMRLSSKDMLLRGLVTGLGVSGLQIVIVGILSSGGFFDHRGWLFFLIMGIVEGICRLQKQIIANKWDMKK